MSRRPLLVLLLLAALSPLRALDRDAFTTLQYRLDVQVDPKSHVMAVNGRMVLRNDSKLSQKNAALQISSALEWNGIGTDSRPADCDCVIFPGDRPLQWVADNYTSDIDHTSGLSEVIVTLPHEIPPGATINLDVQYGGPVTQDATRLTRIGAPAEIAARNDWDQISESFTAVRGLGYVVWYPVSLDAVSLSDGNAVFDALARWKLRHHATTFFAYLGVTLQDKSELPCIVTSPDNSGAWRVAGGQGFESPSAAQPEPGYPQRFGVTMQAQSLEQVVPAFVILPQCTTLSRPTIEIISIPAHADLAKDYAVAAEASDPLLHEWLGDTKQPARVIELTDPNANPYQNGGVLFTPLREAQTATLQLLLLPAQVAARFQSPRAWIQEGLERFLQAMSVKDRLGRKAAIQYLDEYRAPLVKLEQDNHPANGREKEASLHEADNNLLNTTDELYLRGKSSFVFWMLRDMVGDELFQRTLAAYRPDADKNSAYFQKLLESNAKRELEWFFDDWVYRDRGLPEFHVESAYVRPLLSGTEKNYMVTVSIENKGRAGAEVPAIIETPSGDKVVRVIVKGGQKNAGRIEVPVSPNQVKVNDGSVPEANVGNNVYDIPQAQQP